MQDLLPLFLFGLWTLGCLYLGVRWGARRRGDISIVPFATGGASPLTHNFTGEAEPEDGNEAPQKPTDGVNFTL